MRLMKTQRLFFLKELKEYSKFSSYPSDLLDWFNNILYPPKDDPLYELPWDLEYTQFKLPGPSFLATLDIIPWANMVRQSCCICLSIYSYSSHVEHMGS